jgi:hypothetical protein
MRKCRTSGSVRGVPSNGHPYRNRGSWSQMRRFRLFAVTRRNRWSRPLIGCSLRVDDIGRLRSKRAFVRVGVIERCASADLSP